MRHLLVVLALLALPINLSAQSDGTHKTASLLGGTYSNTTGTPFALIMMFDYNKWVENRKSDPNAPIPQPIYQCSGALVAPNLILTAAHCIMPDFAARGHLANINGKSYLASNIEKHPRYVYLDYKSTNPKKRALNLYTDVGVITLSENITDVTPLPILVDEPLSAGESVVSNGFGTNETVPLPATSINDLLLAFRSAALSVSKVNNWSFVTSYSLGHTTVCGGDSGGPVTRDLGNYRGILGVNSLTTVTSINDQSQCVVRSDGSNGDIDEFPLLGSKIALPFLRKFSGIQFLSGRFIRFANALPQLIQASSTSTTATTLAELKNNAQQILQILPPLRILGNTKRRQILNQIKTTATKAFRAKTIAIAQKWLQKVPPLVTKLSQLSIAAA